MKDGHLDRPYENGKRQPPGKKETHVEHVLSRARRDDSPDSIFPGGQRQIIWRAGIQAGGGPSLSGFLPRPEITFNGTRHKASQALIAHCPKSGASES
jgi:hypothetical protein